MGWTKNPKVRDLEPYCKAHGYAYCVVFAVQEGHVNYEINTYGRNAQLCQVAALAGEQLPALIEEGRWPRWPDERPALVPARPDGFDLARLQRELAPWVKHNFGARPSWHPLLGIVEEAGELAHAHLKGVQGIRGTPEAHRAAKIDAVADIIVFIADYCNAEGIDLQEALETTWAKVKQRDWKKNPATANNI